MQAPDESSAVLQLWRRLKPTPLVADRKAVAAKMKDLTEAARGDARLAPLLADAAVAALLGAIADHSPFLWRLASGDTARLADMLTSDPDTAFDSSLLRLA
ncbi:MAG: hypothetical protein KDJ40_15645, partial [Hyphomicrobiales bacterium]|nr:hypothetical protein [Hyphomicrobiales bacterium]